MPNSGASCGGDEHGTAPPKTLCRRRHSDPSSFPRGDPVLPTDRLRGCDRRRGRGTQRWSHVRGVVDVVLTFEPAAGEAALPRLPLAPLT
jgi:hypothetical protein